MAASFRPGLEPEDKLEEHVMTVSSGQTLNIGFNQTDTDDTVLFEGIFDYPAALG